MALRRRSGDGVKSAFRRGVGEKEAGIRVRGTRSTAARRHIMELGVPPGITSGGRVICISIAYATAAKTDPLGDALAKRFFVLSLELMTRNILPAADETLFTTTTVEQFLS